MRGEGRGKMGAGVGGCASTREPSGHSGPAARGEPRSRPPHGLGGPPLQTPTLGWAAGAGLPLPFLQVEKGVCGLSPRVPCSASCPHLLPEVDSGNPSWEPRPRVHSGAQFTSSPTGFKQQVRAEPWEHRGCAGHCCCDIQHKSVAQRDRRLPGPRGVLLDRVSRGPAVSPEAAGEPVSRPLIS